MLGLLCTFKCVGYFAAAVPTHDPVNQGSPCTVCNDAYRKHYAGLQAEGAYTKMGTWAPTETDAEVIEMMADKDEEWDRSLKGKSEWINRPAQPPGLLRTGAWPPPSITRR